MTSSACIHLLILLHEFMAALNTAVLASTKLLKTSASKVSAGLHCPPDLQAWIVATQAMLSGCWLHRFTCLRAARAESHALARPRALIAMVYSLRPFMCRPFTSASRGSRRPSWPSVHRRSRRSSARFVPSAGQRRCQKWNQPGRRSLRSLTRRPPLSIVAPQRAVPTRARSRRSTALRTKLSGMSPGKRIQSCMKSSSRRADRLWVESSPLCHFARGTSLLTCKRSPPSSTMTRAAKRAIAPVLPRRATLA
mmetsp:Transcript_79571/g.233955  ORF Transcript_79571/g.233955 Transcript_79571/m.233955 type:complete len:252 (+) Transcript_79571:1337-2092(+)